MPAGSSRGFAHQPALDGVRALAVVAVLLFHQGWLGGGYVGVSVFFTLSGYLLTSLALHEHARTGRVDVRAFYGRRARRLLPASMVCLAGVAVLGVTGVVGGGGDLRRDLWAALAQVYNWVALGGESYADLVGTANADPSPLAHYWSLAIEEQCYLVWPVVLLGLVRARRRRRVLVVGALAAASAVAAPLIAIVWGPDAAYWATPARVGEILVGAAVAVVLHARWSGPALPASAAWLGPIGLGVVAWAAVTWPSGSGPAYEGWLPVFALASAALLVGVQVPSALTRSLSAQPLVALGAVSYGVYLYHWPVYVVLDADRTGLVAAPLFAVRLAVTLALAAASYHLLERPVRRGVLRRPAPATLGAVAAVGLAVAVLPLDHRPYWVAPAASATLDPPRSFTPLRVAALRPSPSTIATATAFDRAVSIARADPATTSARQGPTVERPRRAAPSTTTALPGTTSTVGPAATTTSVASVTDPRAVPPLPAALARPARIVVVGDSTAEATGAGLVAWSGEHPALADVAVEASPGCGFLRGGTSPVDADAGMRDRCAALLGDRLPAVVGLLRPDVVVGMVTVRDVEDRVWDGAEGPLDPGDPRFAARLVADYGAATDSFLAAGAGHVVWVVAPIPAVGGTAGSGAMADAARHDRYAAALREVVAGRPGRASIADLRGWLAGEPSMPERPDGLHWSPDAARRIAHAFLGPVAVAAAVG